MISACCQDIFNCKNYNSALTHLFIPRCSEEILIIVCPGSRPDNPWMSTVFLLHPGQQREQRTWCETQRVNITGHDEMMNHYHHLVIWLLFYDVFKNISQIIPSGIWLEETLTCPRKPVDHLQVVSDIPTQYWGGSQHELTVSTLVTGSWVRPW